jgi:hypothetical protein
MTRYRDHRRQVILPLIMAAPLMSLAACGDTHAASVPGDEATQSPASNTRTPAATERATPSRMTARPGTQSPAAACLRPGNGATVTNSDLASSQAQLCLKPGDHVTVELTASPSETWEPHPQLTGAAVHLTTAVQGNTQRLQLTAVHPGRAAIVLGTSAVHGPASQWTLVITVR